METKYLLSTKRTTSKQLAKFRPLKSGMTCSIPPNSTTKRWKNPITTAETCRKLPKDTYSHQRFGRFLQRVSATSRQCSGARADRRQRGGQTRRRRGQMIPAAVGSRYGSFHQRFNVEVQSQFAALLQVGPRVIIVVL